MEITKGMPVCFKKIHTKIQVVRFLQWPTYDMRRKTVRYQVCVTVLEYRLRQWYLGVLRFKSLWFMGLRGGGGGWG